MEDMYKHVKSSQSQHADTELKSGGRAPRKPEGFHWLPDLLWMVTESELYETR